MPAHAEALLPNGDYIVQRTELRSGRVLLVYVPDALTKEESQQVARELRQLAEMVEDCGGAVPTFVDGALN